MANRRSKKGKQPFKSDYNPPYPSEVLSLSVEGLGLREGTLNLLKGAGVATIRDLAIREEKDFYRIHTFNKKNLFDVKNALKRKNVAIKPTQEKQEAPAAAPAQEKKGNTEKQPQSNAKKQEAGKQQQKNGKGKSKSDNRDKYSVDESFVMTTLPPKPPRPKSVPVKEEPDIYVKVNKGGKWGFRERNGKQAVEPVYDEVFCFRENVCCVEKDEKFGFINRQGEVIVPLMYDCATSFSEGLACVFKKEKCGYIDMRNEIVVDFRFDAATPVIGGECRVKKDGKWGEMHITRDEDGKVVVSDIRWIT